jgi:hypothetical protein
MPRYLVDDYGDKIYPEDVGSEREGPCRCSRDGPCECPQVCSACGKLSSDVDEDGVCEPCALSREDEGVVKGRVVDVDDASGMCVTCAEEPVPVRGQECSLCAKENA